MDLKAQCQKCGCKSVSVHYDPLGDSLERKCVRCGFKWDEAPDDADPASNPLEDLKEKQP